MAFYYVKSGGTATGDAGRATTKRTGSFAAMGASAYYDSIKDVWNGTGAVPTTAITNSDVIVVSAAHDKNGLTGGYTTVSKTGFDAVPPIYIIVVDDANADQPVSSKPSGISAAPREIFTGYLNLFCSVYMLGLAFGSSNNSIVQDAMTCCIFKNCVISVGGALGQSGTQETNSLKLLNTDLYCNATDNYIRMYAGDFQWLGGAIHSSGSAPQGVFGGNKYWGTKEGVKARISGVDLSHHSTTAPIFGLDTAAFAGFDDCVIERCTLPSTFVLLDPADIELTTFNARIALYHSDDTTGEKQYNMLDYRGMGNIVDETTVARTDGDTLPDGSTYLSYKVATIADCGPGNPLAFTPYGDRYYKAADEAGSKVRVYFASTDSGLTDQDVWAEVAYASSAEPAKGLIASNQNSDPLFGSGTTHQTDSGSAWQNAASYTKYYMDINMASGGDGPVTVHLHVGKASTTVIFDSEFDFVA